MSLKNLLSEKKKSILGKWFNLILETYPSETIQFLKSQKDRFANPVGSIIFQGIEDILDQFLQESESEKISTFLDNVIRIRAVQDFTASQAVIFIFHLKKVIREELKNEIREKGLYDELLVLESAIDDLALLSFDIFMKCREQVYELKANEVKNMTYSLLKKANLIFDIKEQELAPQNDNIDNFIEKR
jgi:RsbT co-antagonist protein rsbRD N-terminal domain